MCRYYRHLKILIKERGNYLFWINSQQKIDIYCEQEGDYHHEISIKLCAETETFGSLKIHTTYNKSY